MDLGIFIIRLVVGLYYAAHGSQKLFGWFGGGGPQGTGGFFEQIGIKPGKTMALLAGLSEFGGGILFLLGFLTPLAAILIIIPMIVAIVKVHAKNGLFSDNSGIEYNVVLIAVALGIWLTGPGAISLDAAIFDLY
ncbi:DoxX family protein [Bacillus sp. V59.32b]|nr:DoxX family protein [Bacillus sp. V59.32b]